MDPRPAVFLDRDGTINEEVEFLSDPSRCRLLPGAAEGIRLLNRAGRPVLIVTNQSGVGRGYFDLAAVEAVHDRLNACLAEQGARVDGIYVCPHHPDDGCTCRKPGTGLLLRAAEAHRIDLARSYLVGDKTSDLQAGRRAGCRVILVRTGYGAAHRPASPSPEDRPDFVAENLLDAATWILGRPPDSPGTSSAAGRQAQDAAPSASRSYRAS